MKNLFVDLYGNERIKSTLGNEILTSKFAHAYIIAGNEGCGKHTTAQIAAAALGCTSDKSSNLPFPCNECLHCKKVAKHIHPDIEIYNRKEKATIGVDVIRQMREKLYITPNESPYKVIIIEEADKMTVQAQNALLLSLESPPPFVVFFLLTDSPEILLETIRSRAPIIQMQSFSGEEIEMYIKENYRKYNISADKLTTLSKVIPLCNGSIGNAIYYLTTSDKNIEKDFEPKQLGEKVFLTMCSGNAIDAISLINELNANKKRLPEILNYAIIASRDAIVIKKNNNASLLFFESQEYCLQKTKMYTIKKINSIIDALEKGIQDISHHVSITTILPTMLLKKYS